MYGNISNVIVYNRGFTFSDLGRGAARGIKSRAEPGSNPKRAPRPTSPISTSEPAPIRKLQVKATSHATRHYGTTDGAPERPHECSHPKQPPPDKFHVPKFSVSDQQVMYANALCNYVRRKSDLPSIQ